MMQVPHIVLLSCLSGTKLINENCVLTTLHISEFWLVRRHVATHAEQSIALEKHWRTPQKRIWSRSEIRNGSLPKFNGDFTVQRHINDKIFTKICSVFFPTDMSKIVKKCPISRCWRIWLPKLTRCSAIAERPRCRVRYSFR